MWPGLRGGLGYAARGRTRVGALSGELRGSQGEVSLEP